MQWPSSLISLSKPVTICFEISQQFLKLKILNIFLNFTFMFDIRERRMEGEREAEKHRLSAFRPTRDRTATQTCALTGNRATDLSVCRMTPNQLSHTGWATLENSNNSLICSLAMSVYILLFCNNYWQSLLPAASNSCPEAQARSYLDRHFEDGLQGHKWSPHPSCRAPPLSCGCCCHQSGPRSGPDTLGSSRAPGAPDMCSVEGHRAHRTAFLPPALPCAAARCLISCMSHGSTEFHLRNIYLFQN